MLLTYSRAFSMACADLEMTRGGINLAVAAGKNEPFDKNSPFHQQLQENLGRMKGLCSQVPSLNRLLPPIERLERYIETPQTPQSVMQYIHSFQHSLFDELARHVYYHVEERLVPYYETEIPFGEEVFQNFPSANDDIRNAGRCLALGQGTACVFHLMLVLESGLRALGKALDIPYAPSWESYLSQINKKMAENYNQKTDDWRRDESFYRDVAGDLQLVKIAWRNPTMHIVRGKNYDSSDAEAIYLAASKFMGRLATKLSEAQTPSTNAVVELVSDEQPS